MSATSPLHRRFIQLSTPMQPEQTGTEPKLRLLQGIRAVVYDFYGTLFISGVGDIGIDDGASDAKLLKQALLGSGVEIQSPDAGKAGFEKYNRIVNREITRLKNEGIPWPEPDIRTVWKDVLQEMFRENLVSGSADISDLARRMSVEFEARMNPVWPMPDAADTLSWFRDRNILQGIISNSQFYTPIVLEALTGRSLDNLGFDRRLLHWSYEEKMKKPGLDFYRNYLKKVRSADESLSASEILFVGNDMLKDVYPAASVGMKTALFAGDRRSLKWRTEDERCKNLEPDLVITSLGQLKECVWQAASNESYNSPKPM